MPRIHSRRTTAFASVKNEYVIQRKKLGSCFKFELLKSVGTYDFCRAKKTFFFQPPDISAAWHSQFISEIISTAGMMMDDSNTTKLYAAKFK